jgi:hypothetical protein
MKKKLELTLDQAKIIYKTADAGLKEILEANFGKTNLIGRPIGVWCLTKDRRAVKAEDWDSKDTSIGVGVVTENTSFIVHLEPQTALPLGSMDVEKYYDIVYDTTTYDNLRATIAIANAHKGKKGKIWDDDKFPFVGAPAAEYCLKKPAALPTLATAKEIAANIKTINKAMMVVGGAVVCGWLWTSTIKKENHCAFVVNADIGNVNYVNRNYTNNARAVSAFRFENFKF